MLFNKTSLKTGELLLFNCCKLLCSSRVLRVANLQKPKMGFKQNVPSRRRSLSTYEVTFAVLFVILVALCAGLIAVSWLSIQGSEKGKLYKVGYRKCSRVNIYTPESCQHIVSIDVIDFLARYLYCIQMLHLSSHHRNFFFKLVYNFEFNSEFEYETKYLKWKND